MTGSDRTGRDATRGGSTVGATTHGDVADGDAPGAGGRRGGAGATTARVLGAVGVLAVLAAAALPARTWLWTTVAGGVGRARGTATGDVVALVAEHGYLVLLGGVVVLAVVSWARERTASWRALAGLLGTLLAYAASEGLKVLVAQPRPCRVLDAATVLVCPPAGDHSWPSNHATLGGALATACVLALPRTAALAVTWAAVVAASRVAAGVHHVHDVLSGLALGGLVVAVVVALLRPEARPTPGAWRSAPRRAWPAPGTGRRPRP